jgi:peroxiredoxin
LRSIQEKLEEFKARGIRIVAISVDAVETNRELREKRGYTYPFLSDPKLEAIRRYDLVHAGGFPSGNIARPAEFLLDASGTVRWRNLTENYRVRTKGEDILKIIDELGLGKGNDSR